MRCLKHFLIKRPGESVPVDCARQARSSSLSWGGKELLGSMGCGPVARPLVLGTSNRGFESRHPDAVITPRERGSDNNGNR